MRIEETLTYAYDNSGRLAKTVDSGSGITTTYYYDLIDRLVREKKTGEGYNQDVTVTYDTNGNLTAIDQSAMGRDRHTAYAYDADNRPIDVDDCQSHMDITYDGFSRTNEKKTEHNGTKILDQTYIYWMPKAGATTLNISSIRTEAGNDYTTHNYWYDTHGNITMASDGMNTENYTYDIFGQLIREDSQAGMYTRVWEYDGAGNILSRKEYAYTTGTLGTPTDTVIYTYSTGTWGDLLVSYDGNAITYDGVGNPLSDGTWTYTWEHGRELATMSSGATTWQYTYDADGLRTKRTDGTTTYIYSYYGSKLWQYSINGQAYYITYDATGTPWTLYHNGNTYYYVTNLQGDVVAILNSSGTVVVNYSYDAWGNLLSTTGAMAATLGVNNLLRYRGYIYDTETQLYYLQSRYYNPEIGRFINADALVSTGQGILGYNMIAYCGNNPVLYTDLTGTRHEISAGGFGGGGSDRGNIENIMKLFGVNSPNDIPERPPNCMLFLENIESVTIGTFTFIRGKTIVMDENKYCTYSFYGIGYGYSAIPYDRVVTAGYVYNVNSVNDYAGSFLGVSANMVLTATGSAIAPNGVYATTLDGTSWVSASLGVSYTYYIALDSDWKYGSAPISWYANPYGTRKTMPWDTVQTF